MNEENLALYERVRKVPQTALRPIEAGRLKGKTDINPMWRIKKLTEEFGPCGIGWCPEKKKEWTVPGANGEIAAFVDIDLYVKVDGEWSKPIHGTGGSMLVSREKNGLYTDDECFKKAYTDAISVACKELGIGADVYWEKDSTKYTQKPEIEQENAGTGSSNDTEKSKYERIKTLIKGSGYNLDDVNELIDSKFGKRISINDLTDEQFAALKKILIKALTVGDGHIDE